MVFNCPVVRLWRTIAVGCH